MNHYRQQGYVRNRYESDVSPETGVSRHRLFRFGSRGDAHPRDLGALQRVHQRDQLLHGQFTIGPDYDRHIWICPLQLSQLGGKRFPIDNLSVQSDCVGPIDRDRLHLG